MAVTIHRTPWIDDDGTGQTGTVLNNAMKMGLYDEVDAALAQCVAVDASGYLTRDLLWAPDATYDIGKSVANRPRDVFASRNLTAGGVLTVNGFGTHTFNAAGSGDHNVTVRNLTAGTANSASLYLGNDASASAGAITHTATTYATSVIFDVQDALLINNTRSGGISIAARHVSGAIRFYAGGTTERARINATGTQTWAAYGAGTATFDGSGNITSVSDGRLKDRIAPLPYGLPEVLQLRPVQHGYTADSGLEGESLYGGFLAHEVQAIIPIAVGQDARGYLTLADRPILGALVHAIHALAARLTQLEGRL